MIILANATNNPLQINISFQGIEPFLTYNSSKNFKLKQQKNNFHKTNV